MPKSIAAGIGALVVLTCVCYLPGMRGGFVFDDETLIGNNPRINSAGGLERIWFSIEEYEYYPLSYSSFWLEWRLWGNNPTLYHVTNLALHVAAALLIWAVLSELSIPGAYLAALLFAVHPVNVEAVAWISQRRSVLAMVFFLLSALWYLRAEEEKNRRGEKENRAGMASGWYWLSLLTFLAAMLSKGSVAVEPAVLLLAVWWRQRRIGTGDLARAAPFFVVAIALTAANVWFQTHGTQIVIRNAGFAERLAGAGAVIWFYLSKALLPIRLLFIYPMWHIEVARLLWWLPVIAGIVVTVVVLRNGSPARAKWGRGVLFAWAFFCVALAPVLGLTDVGFMQYSLVADHYQHLAIIGVVAAVAAGWAAWRDASRAANRSVANIAALALVGILAWLTFEQSGLYANSVNLYEETLRFNPECWAAHNNLGVQLDVAGRPQEAEQHFEEALHLKPNYAEAHYNLGNSLARAGDRVAAIKQYREALRLRPGYIEARNNLGIELSHAGRTAEAIECLRESLRFESRAVTYFNLGNVFSEANCPRDAAEQYERAVELRPDYAEAWANLAATYGDLGRWAEAQAAASKAIDLANAQGLTGVIKGIEAWRAANASKFAPVGPGR
jgi:protein O-mannosyl-transferase